MSQSSGNSWRDDVEMSMTSVKDTRVPFGMLDAILYIIWGT